MTRPHHRQSRELARFFTQRQDCTILRQDAHKLLLRANKQGPDHQDYFIKIYQYPHWFHSRLRDWRFVGGCQEYRTCTRLKQIGIPTPEPVGCATDRNWAGIPRQSLYASRWLAEVQTLDAVIRHQHKHRHMDEQSWRHFICDLGRFLGRIHQRLVNAKDLNTKNILVQRQPKTRIRFILVDYERIAYLKKYDLNKFMTPLSQIGAGLLPAFESDIRQLCDGYARQVRPIDVKDLSQKLIVASREKNRQWRQEIDGLFTAIGGRLQADDKTRTP